MLLFAYHYSTPIGLELIVYDGFDVRRSLERPSDICLGLLRRASGWLLVWGKFGGLHAWGAT